MSISLIELEHLIVPAALITAGIIFGLIFDKLLSTSLKKIVLKTKNASDDIIIDSISHRIIVLWFILAGSYAALKYLPLSSKDMILLEKAFLIIIISSITIFIAQIAAASMKIFTKKTKGILPSTSILTSLTQWTVILIGILTILNTLGISITPILTALGVGGLAVALALQDTLSNLFAGLQIILSKQLQPGNYIQLSSGEEGYVADINWRNTTIQALPNNMIVIPNSKISSTIVTNFHLPEKEMAVLVQAGVSYKSDLNKVEQITIEVGKEIMKEVSGGIPDFEPFIRYHTFADFSIKFTVILRAKEFVDKYLIKHEFIKKLHERYKKEGIEIPFPTHTIYSK